MVRPDCLLRGYSVGESCGLSELQRAKRTSDAIRVIRGFVERLLLLLGCLFYLLCLLRFLGHVALRDPKSWLDASRQSTCIDSDYTIIAKLILRAAKRVNDHHTVATFNRTKPSPDEVDTARFDGSRREEVLIWSVDEADDGEDPPVPDSSRRKRASAPTTTSRSV
jgi:hypothetical protein